MRNFFRSPRGRTLFGLALAVAFVPVMLGISACLKTPIGDPEKGWVDPRITGVWLSSHLEFPQGEAVLWTFEPYDSRTWLVTWTGFGEDDDQAADAEDADTAAAETATNEAEPEEEAETPTTPLPPDEVLRILGMLAEGAPPPQGSAVFKGWLTSIGGRRFLILEPKVMADEDRGFRPEVWFVYHVVLKGDQIRLALVGGDAGDLDEATTRGEAEQIIARHIADPEMYSEVGYLNRVPVSAYGQVSEVLTRAGFEQW
jgi:hypothetical protein